MSQNSYFNSISEALTVFFYLVVPIALGLLFGLTALAIAWGGRRAGMAIGVLSFVSSLLGLGSLLYIAPHMWWIAVIPIGIGAATVWGWYHHAGPATARRPRFKLSGLFALILLTSVVLGGVASQQQQRRIENEAVMALTSLPGNVYIRSSLGRVTQIVLNTSFDPANFDQAADALGRFSQLHFLQIDGPIPGHLTQRLGRLTTLRSLLAQRMPVTDDDLRPLANLQGLEFLDLDATQLTDAGLVHLRGLRKLRLLHLYNANKITPAAMNKLRAALPLLDNP